jgi:hypothetical protein
MRTTCWLTRRAIGRSLDLNEPLSDRAAAHCENCSSCRGFHIAQIRLVQRLSRDAAGFNNAETPFLRSLVLDALSSGERIQPSANASRPLWPRLAVGLLAMAIGITLLVLNRNGGPAPAEVLVSAPPPSRQQVAVAPPVLPDFPSVDTEKLREWSLALDQPLENEMQLVVSDARMAIQYLAHTFLPERALGLP